MDLIECIFAEKCVFEMYGIYCHRGGKYRWHT
jgi:hypothetical protein